MSIRLLLCTSILLLLFSACHRKTVQEQDFSGFSYDSKYAFWYKKIQKTPVPLVKIGEEVDLEYTMQKGTVVLVNSRTIQQNVLVEMPLPQDDNFFTKALRYMGNGDSLCQMIKAADARKLLGEFGEHFEDDNDWVTFTYKVKAVNSVQDLAEKVQQEKAQVDSIRENVLNLLSAYKKGKLDVVKAPSSTIEYVILKDSDGKKPKLGDQLTAHYICFNQYGAILDDTFINLIPLKFQLGNLDFIEGWNKSFPLMKEGQKAVFFIPPHLAYGDSEKAEMSGMLVFYLDLLSID
jgi:FKBP-type peptidyl-prolyl cis-trans isomerase